MTSGNFPCSPVCGSFDSRLLLDLGGRDWGVQVRLRLTPGRRSFLLACTHLPTTYLALSLLSDRKPIPISALEIGSALGNGVRGFGGLFVALGWS